MNAPALRVLVIDDEPPIRKLLRMGLSTQGYRVIEAPDGRSALDLIREKPDLVIRDLGPEAPIRKISAATLKGAQRSPAARAMLDVLAEVSAEYSEREAPRLALVS